MKKAVDASGPNQGRFLMIGALASSLTNFRGPLLEALVQQGLDVHAAADALDSDMAVVARLSTMGVTAHSIHVSRTGLNPARDICTFFELCKLMRAVRPDVTLGYTIKPVVWGLLAAWLTGVPHRYAMITGLGYAFTGKARGKRRIVQGFAILLYRLALTRAHGVFFQNPDDLSLFRRWKVLPSNISAQLINGSGVDLTVYQQQPLTKKPLSFLMIARLLGDKGVREFAAAAASIRKEFPAVEFHLVGGLDSNPDGIAKEELLRWQADGVLYWHGEQQDVRPFIAACHVYVLPSYREGMPRTVLEAMAMGRAIITTDAPGCRETVSDGKNGFLVAPKDVTALIKAMRRFILNPGLAAIMAKNSRLTAQTKYASDKVAASIIQAMDIPR